MSCWVYVLKSERTGRYYVGIAEDVAFRLTEHNSGKVDSTGLSAVGPSIPGGTLEPRRGDEAGARDQVEEEPAVDRIPPAAS